MPTILDTLALKLDLDAKPFEQGLKGLTEKTKVDRDEFERHSKGFESVFTALFRALSPIASALAGIAAALAVIDMSKKASDAGTAFANMADVIGMSAEQLSAWKQAAEAAGKGGGEALLESFNRQQQTLQTMLPGGSGLKDTEFLSGLQHYGMQNISPYVKANGEIDLDKFEKSLVSASERIDKSASERARWMQKLYVTNPAQLSLYKSRGGLEEALKYQRDVVGVINKNNTDAMKKLHADFANLGTAAENLGIALTTKLAKPLHEVLTDLQTILNKIKDWEPPAWFTNATKWLVEHGLAPPWANMDAKPPGPDEFMGRARNWEDTKRYWREHLPFLSSGEPPPASAAPANPPPAASPQSVVRTPPRTSVPPTPAPRPSAPPPQPPPTPLPPFSTDPMSGLPLSGPPSAPSGPPSFEQRFGDWPRAGGAIPTPAPPSFRPTSQAPPPQPPVQPTAPAAVTVPPKAEPPAPAVTQPPPSFPPAAPPPAPPRGSITITPEKRTSVPSFPPPPQASPAPEPAPAAEPEKPATFEDRWKSIYGPQSSLAPAMQLQQTAAAVNLSQVASKPSVTNSINSTVSFGSMHFNSTTNDVALNRAPSGSERILSIGQYSVDANVSLV